MWARIRNGYLAAGRLVGGAVGVLGFLAVWIYVISRFGLVFGGALGWIPGAIVGAVLSVLLRWLWLPVALVIALVFSAPAWDKSGVVQRTSARAEVYVVRAAKATERVVRRAAKWTQDEARREGLTKPAR